MTGKSCLFLFFIRESDQGSRPVGPGPQQSCSRLWLKTVYYTVFLTRRPVTSSIKQKSLKRLKSQALAIFYLQIFMARLSSKNTLGTQIVILGTQK